MPSLASASPVQAQCKFSAIALKDGNKSGRWWRKWLPWGLNRWRCGGWPEAVGGRKERTCGGEVKGIGRGREWGKGIVRTRDSHWCWGPNWDFSRFCSHTHSVHSSLKNCCSSDRGGHGVLCLRLDRCLIIMNPDTWGSPWLLPCHILQLRWDWE